MRIVENYGDFIKVCKKSDIEDAKKVLKMQAGRKLDELVEFYVMPEDSEGNTVVGYRIEVIKEVQDLKEYQKNTKRIVDEIGKTGK